MQRTPAHSAVELCKMTRTGATNLALVRAAAGFLAPEPIARSVPGITAATVCTGEPSGSVRDRGANVQICAAPRLARAADRQGVDAQRRLSHADRNGLPLLAAGADTGVQLQVIADHADAGQYIGAHCRSTSRLSPAHRFFHSRSNMLRSPKTRTFPT